MITKEDVKNHYLKERNEVRYTKIPDESQIGVMNGLWANALGKGGIIPIECCWFPASNFLELKLTGLQGNVMKEHQTFGMGTSYNYKNMLWGKLGYYLDTTHELTYPTFGLDFKYDRYLIGMSYIYGDKTLPLSNTIRLTINLEL